MGLYEFNRILLIALLAGSALIALIAATWIVLSITRSVARLSPPKSRMSGTTVKAAQSAAKCCPS